MSTPLNRRQVIASAAALAAPAILPARVLAQDKYPNRPIKLIAPWPTGTAFCMACPRSFNKRAVSARLNAPAAARAEYSPSE